MSIPAILRRFRVRTREAGPGRPAAAWLVGATTLGVVLAASAVVVASPGSEEEMPSARRPVVEDPVLASARAFLDTLDPETRSRASAPINASDRGRWSYLPQKRLGVRLEELDGEQRAAWRAFLTRVLTESGVARFDRIRRTEPVQDRGGGVHTGPEVFAIRFHGLEAAHEEVPRAWAWRIEGHHLHLGETIVDGRVVAATPFMIGSVRRNDDLGEVFLVEDRAAEQLLAGVPDHERATAHREGPVPGDMVTAMRPARDWRLEGGLPLHRAGEHGRRLADDIVDGLLSLRRGSAVETLRARWRGLPDHEIRFTWVGETDRARKHQWRLVSPVLVVEFSHSGGDVEHAHLALRSVEGELPAESDWLDAPGDPGSGTVGE